MNKLIELRRAKMLALFTAYRRCYLCRYVVLPPNFWVSGVKAIAEAAMVGALADWFAVVALFSPRADSDHFSSYGDYPA